MGPKCDPNVFRREKQEGQREEEGHMTTAVEGEGDHRPGDEDSL